MKKIIGTVAIILLSVIVSFGQSIIAAETALTNGELDKAKEAIDGAIQKELQKIEEKNAKNKAKGKMDKIVPVEPSIKAVYTKGTVYQAIATSENEEYRNLAPDAIEVTIDAYKKVLERDKEGGIYALYVQNDALGSGTLPQFYSQILNMGNDFYNSDNMEKTVEYFYKAGLMFDTDTIGLSNAFLVAAQNDMKEQVGTIGNLIMERGTGNSDFYLIYADYFRQKEDFEGLLKVAEAGSKTYPQETDMGKLLVEAYSKLDRVDDAIAILEKQAASEKEAILYANLAILYENKGEPEKAVENYKKALEINPDDYGINYNMGAYYYNQAVEVAKERNNLPSNNRGEFLDQEKAKELMGTIKELYGQAEPYFAKAVELEGEGDDALTILSMLSQMYDTMEMADKKKAVDAKIKEME